MTLTEAIEYCERKQRDREIDASNATSKSVWDRETEVAEALRLVVDAAKRHAAFAASQGGEASTRSYNFSTLLAACPNCGQVAADRVCLNCGRF